MKKKIFSLLLSFTMVITMMPVMAFATVSETAPGKPVVIAKATPSGSRAVNVRWFKTTDATRYVVYGNLYGKKLSKIRTLDKTKTSYKVTKIGKKKLKKNKVYRFQVYAYKTITGGASVLISKSKTLNVIVGKTMGKKNKYSNATSVSINNKSVKLEAGDSGYATKLAGINSKMYKSKKHLSSKYGKKYSYIVMNNEQNQVGSSVVSVDKYGKLRVNKLAKVGEKAKIYVQELNGVYNTFSVIVATSKESDLEEAKQEGIEEGKKAAEDEAASAEAERKAAELAANKETAIKTVSAEAAKTKNKLEMLTLTVGTQSIITNSITDIVLSAEASIASLDVISSINEARDIAKARLNAIRTIIGIVDASKAPKQMMPYMTDEILKIKAASQDKIEEIIDEAQKYDVFDIKGDLITLSGVNIDGQEGDDLFRVIKINGTYAELLAMSGPTKKFNASSKNTTMTFDSYTETVQKYAGSDLDNYLNGNNDGDYYKSLPSTIKEAIVPQNIDQCAYKFLNYTPENTYWTEKSQEAGVTTTFYIDYDDNARENIGKRNVYVLDVRDVVDYLGEENLTTENVNKMWFNTTEIQPLGTCCWLRSASAINGEKNAWIIDGLRGEICTYGCTADYQVRAAFTIDLTGTDWNVAE